MNFIWHSPALPHTSTHIVDKLSTAHPPATIVVVSDMLLYTFMYMDASQSKYNGIKTIKVRQIADNRYKREVVDKQKLPTLVLSSFIYSVLMCFVVAHT